MRAQARCKSAIRLPTYGRKIDRALRTTKPMKSTSLKLKLTYKLDRKEIQMPSSSTFGDLKVGKEQQLRILIALHPCVMGHASHRCFFLCSLQHLSSSNCHQTALPCCSAGEKKTTIRSSLYPA